MSAPPLVLVPGLGSDQRLWQPALDRLEGLIEPTVVLGTGASIAEMADEVFDRAPDRFYLAGISMGGYVALDAALRGSDRIAGLLLLNTSARAASPEQRDRGTRLIRDTEAGRFDAVVDTITTVVAGGNQTVAEVARAMLRDGGAEAFVRQQRALLGRHDRRAELSGIALPTLVIGADDDLVTPPALSSELADLIPHTELHVLAGCGHLSTVDSPSSIAETMRRWLSAQEHDNTTATQGVQSGKVSR